MVSQQAICSVPDPVRGRFFKSAELVLNRRHRNKSSWPALSPLAARYYRRLAIQTTETRKAISMTTTDDTRPSVGDYVLATKYDDGDPCDHFYVGFVAGFTWHGRYLVADNDGRNQRANGFRRAEKITEAEGRQLIDLLPAISDRPGISLWDHLANIRNNQHARGRE